jgi:biotin operon repressor
VSNALITEVYSRQLGSMARKAVLALFADKADDDGAGIWASKQRMAEEIGTTRQTIITTIKSLIDDGLVREVGQRQCANGFTIEYAICIKALAAVPLIASHPSNDLTRKAALPVKPVNATRKAALHKPSQTPRNKPKGEAHPIPDGWWPAEFGPKTKSRAAVDSWPPGELETQVEHFTAHHRARGNRFLDWQDAWSTWALNKAKFGARRNDRPASNDQAPRNPYVQAVIARQAARSADERGQPGGRPERSTAAF